MTAVGQSVELCAISKLIELISQRLAECLADNSTSNIVGK
jgi:hypothetical protein